MRGPLPGPTLLCVGGLHGNEPAGVEALRRIVAALEPRADAVAGEVVAVAGNVAALAAGRRFLERDLNRAWTPAGVARARALLAAGAGAADAHAPASGGLRAEDREQTELLALIDSVVAGARGPVTVIDLHTTSGSGGPFSTFGDSPSNRGFARRLPVPMVLGLEELVEGTLLDHLVDRGLVAVAVETGQHDEAAAVERGEAALWVAIGAAGVVPASRLPEAAAGWERLHRETERLPRVMDMRHRHDVGDGDAFRMRPGYRNFQVVRAGEAVADDRRGPVTTPEDGRILMPLYQEQGQDGYFLVREYTHVEDAGDGTGGA